MLGHVVKGFKDQAWHTILVRPFGRLLATADTARMYKQAAFDIAAATGGSFAKGIRHQDVSPFSIVVYQDRLVSWQGGLFCGQHCTSIYDGCRQCIAL